MKKAGIFKILVILAVIQMIIPNKAYAYIDPGTGSMVLQIIAASLLGLGLTFRIWIQKLKNFLFRGRK